MPPKRSPVMVSASMGAENMQPKGSMTSYAFFVQICREEHKRKYPEEHVVFHEFAKKCAERWKTMTEKEKVKFQQMAEDDKKRYDVEMQSYVPPAAAMAAANKSMPKSRQKKKKDPNAPKRSMSAFFWFSQDERKKVREKNPNYGVGEVAKELGRRWADADATLKSKYEALAEKDRTRYGQEKKAYQQQQKAAATQAAKDAAAAANNEPSQDLSVNGEDIDDEDESE